MENIISKKSGRGKGRDFKISLSLEDEDCGNSQE